VIRSAGLALTVIAISIPGFAETLTFEQGVDGYLGFADTSIFEENDFSGGGTDAIFSGTNGQLDTRRALIRANLVDIPAGSTVTGVQFALTVSMSGDNFGDIDYALHRVTAGWGEGAVVGLSEGGFGAPSNPGDATWTERRRDEASWDTPGGDFVAMPSATAAAGRADDLVVWTGPGLVDDVQAWVDEADTNHGWIIIGALEGSLKRVKRFHSSEAAAFGPRLIVEYDQPPPENLPIARKALWIAVVFLSIAMGVRAAGTHRTARPI